MWSGNANNLYASLSILWNVLSQLTSLHYLMALESVLCEENVWEEVIPGTYHCQVEQFHLIFWKAGWPHVDFFNVYLPVHIGDMLRCASDMFQVTQRLGNPQTEALIGFAVNSFNQWFLQKYLWRKVPSKMKSLKDLSRYQLAVNVFIKRIYAFSEFPLTPLEVENTDLVECTDEFIRQMEECRQFLIQVKEDRLEACNAVRGVASARTITQEDIDFIWHKATFLPLEVMLNVMLNYEGFNQWGFLIGFHKLTQWEAIFNPQAASIEEYI